jgi:hypothetical protein
MPRLRKASTTKKQQSCFFLSLAFNIVARNLVSF